MIAVLIGTRPEFIKLSPVLKELKQKGISFKLIHSGQHYSKELDEQIIDDLNLPKPDYNLKVGSASHAEQTGKIMVGVEKILIKEKPDVLVVHGDTNTMLAGSLTAVKLHIPVAHVEAGLRSFDTYMPEEINRMITDKISTLLFAPTKVAQQNLLNDGIDKRRIFITGNTVADALIEHIKLVNNSDILKQLNLREGDYILVTAHRAENVDRLEMLQELILLLDYSSQLLNKPIIWPVHPHTYKQLTNNNIKISKNIKLISPTGYVDMLALIKGCLVVMTDSGGIQEEAYLLKKWLVTLRNSTERPETLTANFLVSLDKEKVKEALNSFKEGRVRWDEEVFGRGNASKLIVKHLKDFIENNFKIS